MKIKRRVAKQEKVTKIDIGCGKQKREGFTGIDIIDFEGVDIVMNAGKEKWPFKDGSVDEVHASHFLEHLEPMERVHFVNELYRVLKPPEYDGAGRLVKGLATVIVPHWASQRAYGDLTHKWPAVSEFWFYYLDKDWRAVNAPHNDFYTCNLVVTWGYNMHPEIVSRNSEYQQNAMKWWKEACSDTIATLIKK
jgi:SAM-dependent methyltransferase